MRPRAAGPCALRGRQRCLGTSRRDRSSGLRPVALLAGALPTGSGFYLSATSTIKCVSLPPHGCVSIVLTSRNCAERACLEVRVPGESLGDAARSDASGGASLADRPVPRRPGGTGGGAEPGGQNVIALSQGMGWLGSGFTLLRPLETPIPSTSAPPK